MDKIAKWLLIPMSIGIIILTVATINQISWIKYYEDYILQLQSEITTLTTQAEESELTKSNTTEKITKPETDTIELISEIEEPEEKPQDTLPYLVNEHSQPELINQNKTHNPSWAELKNFLSRDDTDKDPYIEEYRMCGDFAEALHDNAELAGIRAAFVIIDFGDYLDLHALNAFDTTDWGLVYIDCTGYDQTDTSPNWSADCPYEYDKVAYVQIGSPLGFISIDKVESIQYNYYTEYKQNELKCNSMLEDYNNEVTRYSKEIEGKIYYKGSPELAAIEAWEERINEMEINLDKLMEIVSCREFKPLETVKSIEIYW